MAAALLSESLPRSSAALVVAAIRDIVAEPPESQALQRLHDMLADCDGQAVVAELQSQLSGDQRDRQLLLLMGCLERFTRDAVTALSPTQSDRDMAIFELARRTRAWGRWYAVPALNHTTDPEIKAWLLRQCCQGHTVDQYLAYIAATTGRAPRRTPVAARRTGGRAAGSRIHRLVDVQPDAGSRPQSSDPAFFATRLAVGPDRVGQSIPLQPRAGSQQTQAVAARQPAG